MRSILWFLLGAKSFSAAFEKCTSCWRYNWLAFSREWGNESPLQPCKASFLHSLLRASQITEIHVQCKAETKHVNNVGLLPTANQLWIYCQPTMGMAAYGIYSYHCIPSSSSSPYILNQAPISQKLIKTWASQKLICSSQCAPSSTIYLPMHACVICMLNYYRIFIPFHMDPSWVMQQKNTPPKKTPLRLRCTRESIEWRPPPISKPCALGTNRPMVHSPPPLVRVPARFVGYNEFHFWVRVTFKGGYNMGYGCIRDYVGLPRESSSCVRTSPQVSSIWPLGPA